MRQIFRALAKAEDERTKLIIGLDTSWIPGTQRGMTQSLVNAIERADEKDGVKNLIVVRGDAKTLAAGIEEKLAETGTPLKNVVILASQETLGESCVNFEKFKQGPTGALGAFMAAVDSSELTDFSDVRLVEMLTVALKMAFGEKAASSPELEIVPISERIVRLIPRASKVDPAELKRRYELQTQTIVAA
jgi:hypothetical protein